MAATLSSKTTRAANKLISVATKNIGANIYAYAAYMRSAREDGLTIAALNRELEALDVDNVLPKRATLGVYAQAVDMGDKLALNSAADYALVFSAIARVRRTKGYDLQATFAPIADIEELGDRRDALRLVGTANGLPVVSATDSVADSGVADSVADNVADSVDSLTDSILDHLNRATNGLKSAKLSAAEYARLVPALNALVAAAKKAQPKR